MSKVQTVKGSISSEQLGVTLPHEHIIWDFSCLWKKPNEASLMSIVDKPVSLEILGMLKREPTASYNKDNLVLCDVDLITTELRRFKIFGGNSVVDLTTSGTGRDPKALREISERTGINIICSTGYFLVASHPPYVKEKGVDELAEIMVRELTEGINNSDIRAGVIKLACSPELHPDEEKVLRAGARAQAKTNAALTIHPGNWSAEHHKQMKQANKYIDIIQKEGVDLNKVWMSHMCSSCTDLDYHRSVLKRGIMISYDCFALEEAVYFDHIYPGAYGISDRERVEAIVELCGEGYEKQLLMSHDMSMKIGLVKYGGYGYAHILEHIVPALKHEGVSDTQIRNMMIENPKRILSW